MTPSVSNFILQTRTFLSSFGTKEHKLLEIFSGSMGITCFGKYIDVPLFMASLSICESCFTISATSAIAT